MWPVARFVLHDTHVAVSTHAALVVAAVLAGTAVAVRRAREPLALLGLVPVVVVAALGGAWLLFRALHGPPGGGLASMGGIASGVLATLAVARLFRLPFVRLTDELAPGAILALGIGRVGCFLAGCCFGRPTDMPWGVVLPELGALPRHPLQLYAAAADVALALALLFGSGPRGTVTRRALVGLGLVRLGLETLRDPAATDPVLGGWCSLAQLGAAALVVAGLLVAPRSRAPSPGGPADPGGILHPASWVEPRRGRTGWLPR